MDHHIHFSMLLGTSILTIPFLLITTLPQSHCQLPPPPFYDYSICREHSYNCGNLSNIFYPFWGHNRPPYCGASEAFKLNCDDGHNTTTILIGSLNFTVLDISTTTNTMSMKRTDLAHDVCSPQFTDTYLSPSLFQYSPSVRNITIFYNCPSEVIFSDSICGQNNAICHVGAEDELLKTYPELKTCERHIQVPAGFPHEPYVSGVIDRDDLERGLSEGFQVNYCVECPGSIGDCWSSDIDNQVKLSCYYCPDGSTASLCSVPSDLNTPNKSSINASHCWVPDPESWCVLANEMGSLEVPKKGTVEVPTVSYEVFQLVKGKREQNDKSIDATIATMGKMTTAVMFGTTSLAVVLGLLFVANLEFIENTPQVLSLFER